MIATTSPDCLSIEISSEFLLVDNQENLLSITHNGEQVYNLTLNPNITTYTITNASLSLDPGALADGIYSLKLTTTALNGDIHTELICVAILCGVHCDMVELYTDVNNAEKILAYEALKVAQDCVTCNCDTMLLLYSILTNTTTNGCGCQ